MAATTVATGAGASAVVLLLDVLKRRSCSDYSRRSPKRRMCWRPVPQAPMTGVETIMALSETLSFIAESLGKWSMGDLKLGINYLKTQWQVNLQVASVYAGENSVELKKGVEMINQLRHYLKLLNLCMLFSKKPFPVFLATAGYSEADVLVQRQKARILKPAFSIIHDRDSKCFLLIIRGTHSYKDALTAATGTAVPFHHSSVENLGYAHCGMVAAARWIAKRITPILLKALLENPDHEVKIVGHSLGGGTAALLTYILREQKELSSITCVTFAPAACMTWELAESGKHFITTFINGSDIVPAFSTASVDDLLSEVVASSRLNRLHRLRGRVERNRVSNVIYRSATDLGPRRPVEAIVAVASALHMAQQVSSWTCQRRRVVNTSSDVSERLQFYPPGRIMHMVSLPLSEVSTDDDPSSPERVGIYETSRELYGKLRLSKTMIKDHYMPMYKRMMELLIEELENEVGLLHV